MIAVILSDIALEHRIEFFWSRLVSLIVAAKPLSATPETESVLSLQSGSMYSDAMLSPPQRPPPLSDQSIDDWQRQITQDFNFIYDTLQRKQDSIESKQIKSDSKQPSVEPFERLTDNTSEEMLVFPFSDPKEPLYQSDRVELEVDPIDFTIEMPTQGIDRSIRQPFGPHLPVNERLLSNHLSETVSPHQYDEQHVNIHFKTPVNQLKFDQMNEEELNRRRDQVIH